MAHCNLKDWAALISAIAWPTIVAAVLFYFKEQLRDLLSRVTNTKLFGIELTALAASTKATSASLALPGSGFDKIKDLLDWNKVAAEVRRWAAMQRAPNPSDMGPENFKRFLYDMGLPGGQAVELEREPDGSLKYK
ncbi:hypothetical protein [Bradyrhizobium diazoefficiens]|uniref:hypothetical protein n=1 Tax=Bradyrhizobium diazoefficiens TaxID=1355477 RepID=UPI0027155392|nr:hypothetical protein [Bradyrhizobium diazoefficiens]WLA53190.1 hypothetical protein QIH81_21625 [Bradyrhizobium diazoefficiens]